MMKYLAELLGTFVLTLAVGLSLAGAFPVPVPVVAALAVGLFVYTVGHISGTHLNPAITVAVWSLGKMSMRDGAFYIAAQFVGAGVAYFILRAAAASPLLPVSDVLSVGLAEALGALLLSFGIAAVIYGRIHQAASGIVVGGSLLLGIALASPMSSGILNPAVALGLKSFSFMYVLGPVAGALVGMWIFKALDSKL